MARRAAAAQRHVLFVVLRARSSCPTRRRGWVSAAPPTQSHARRRGRVWRWQRRRRGYGSRAFEPTAAAVFLTRSEGGDGRVRGPLVMGRIPRTVRTNTALLSAAIRSDPVSGGRTAPESPPAALCAVESRYRCTGVRYI